MPTPEFWESRAAKLWPHRWLLGISAFGLCLLLYAMLRIALAFDLRFPIAHAFEVFVPVFCWLWGLTLAGVWFHPTRGTMRLGSPWLLRAPRFAQIALRWYAAVFLAAWFLLPLLVASLSPTRR